MRAKASAPLSRSARPSGTRIESRLPATPSMDHARYSDEYVAGILGAARSIAMIGASATTNRPSYFAMKYLIAKGYSVIPVNPGLAGREILGQRVYASLAEVPGPVDIVDIFRSSDAALEIAREAIRLKD